MHCTQKWTKNKERTIPSFRGICVDLDLWWDTVLCVEMWAGEHFLGIKKTPRLCTFVGDKNLHCEFFNASGLTGKLPWLLGNSTVSSTDVPNHRSEPPTPPKQEQTRNTNFTSKKYTRHRGRPSAPCTPKSLTGVTTNQENLCESSAKTLGAGRRFNVRDADGMQLCSRGSRGGEKENSLIHNITPRLSMQIHSTLETEKLTISTTLQEKAINCVKPCSIKNSTSLLPASYDDHTDYLHLQSCSNALCMFWDTLPGSSNTPR